MNINGVLRANDEIVLAQSDGISQFSLVFHDRLQFSIADLHQPDATGIDHQPISVLQRRQLAVAVTEGQDDLPDSRPRLSISNLETPLVRSRIDDRQTNLLHSRMIPNGPDPFVRCTALRRCPTLNELAGRTTDEVFIDDCSEAYARRSVNERERE